VIKGDGRPTDRGAGGCPGKPVGGDAATDHDRGSS
jgi:hypothetical protein